MIELHLPEALSVSISVNGTPLPGGWVRVTLPMRTKNPFQLLFGPSSPSGSLVISRTDLLREIQKQRDLFLMDYADPAKEWSGELLLRPLNRADVQKVLKAYALYSSTGIYPPQIEEQLLHLDEVLERAGLGEICVTLTSSTEVTVRTENARLE